MCSWRNGLREVRFFWELKGLGHSQGKRPNWSVHSPSWGGVKEEGRIIRKILRETKSAEELKEGWAKAGNGVQHKCGLSVETLFTRQQALEGGGRQEAKDRLQTSGPILLHLVPRSFVRGGKDVPITPGNPSEVTEVMRWWGQFRPFGKERQGIHCRLSNSCHLAVVLFCVPPLSSVGCAVTCASILLQYPSFRRRAWTPSTYPSAPSPSSWTLRTRCWVTGTLVLWLSLMLSSGTPLTSFSFSRGEWSANNGGSKLTQRPQAARTDEGEKKLQGAPGASWPQQASLDLLFCAGTTWATAERMKSQGGLCPQAAHGPVGGHLHLTK